jgi:hypothetical protein
MAALQRHVVVSAPPEPPCCGAVFWQSNAFSARSSSQNERRFASLALPYPLCLTCLPRYRRRSCTSGTIEGETTLTSQRSCFNHSLISRLVEMSDVVRLIGKNEICHCAGSLSRTMSERSPQFPSWVEHALGYDNELKRRGGPLER